MDIGSSIVHEEEEEEPCDGVGESGDGGALLQLQEIVGKVGPLQDQQAWTESFQDSVMSQLSSILLSQEESTVISSAQYVRPLLPHPPQPPHFLSPSNPPPLLLSPLQSALWSGKKLCWLAVGAAEAVTLSR